MVINNRVPSIDIRNSGVSKEQSDIYESRVYVRQYKGADGVVKGI